MPYLVVLVSSKVPLIVHNDPNNNNCVGVTPSGAGSVFTADVDRLGLDLGLAPFVRGRSRVTDGVRGHCQGALRLPRRMCACTLNRMSLPTLVTSFTWSLEHYNYLGRIDRSQE